MIFIQIKLEKRDQEIVTLERRVVELQEHLRMQGEITVLCLACTQQRMEQETEEREMEEEYQRRREGELFCIKRLKRN